MQGKLVEDLVRSRIYPGNFIMFNNEKLEVSKVNDKTVLVKDNEDIRRISKEEIEDSVIKYTVLVDDKIFDLSYTDYHLAIESDKIVQGYTVEVKTAAREGEAIRINCLRTVDELDLHDPNDRFGVITKKDRSFFTIDLSRSNRGSIRLHRTKFVRVNEKDSKIFFKLRCNKCNR